MKQPKSSEEQILAAIADLAKRQSKLEIAMNEMITAFMDKDCADPSDDDRAIIETDDPSLSLALTVMKRRIAEIHEFATMQLAVTQVMAIKMGLTQDHYDALSPRPVPTPFDLMDMLKPKA